jgi:hypothetical protein
VSFSQTLQQTFGGPPAEQESNQGLFDPKPDGHHLEHSNPTQDRQNPIDETVTLTTTDRHNHSYYYFTESQITCTAENQFK